MPLRQRVAGALREQDQLQGVPVGNQVLAASARNEIGLRDGRTMLFPQIRAYADAGVQELMLQIFDNDDIDGLDAFSEQVMPQAT